MAKNNKKETKPNTTKYCQGYRASLVRIQNGTNMLENSFNSRDMKVYVHTKCVCNYF